MSERVRVTLTDGVADVRLTRPEKLNALDPAMFEGLVETGPAPAGDPPPPPVVVSGEGRGFCAGLDFASFMALGTEGGPRLLRREEHSPVNAAQRAAWVWTEVPVPVIAAVHGVAYGGGLQIALAADVRLVAPDTQLSVMEIKWGLIPKMCGTQTMRLLVGLHYH